MLQHWLWINHFLFFLTRRKRSISIKIWLGLLILIPKRKVWLHHSNHLLRIMNHSCSKLVYVWLHLLVLLHSKLMLWVVHNKLSVWSTHSVLGWKLLHLNHVWLPRETLRLHSRTYIYRLSRLHHWIS